MGMTRGQSLGLVLGGTALVGGGLYWWSARRRPSSGAGVTGYQLTTPSGSSSTSTTTNQTSASGTATSHGSSTEASSSKSSTTTTPSHAAPSCVGYYPVVSGDTLSGIANRAGVSLSALEQANPSISNPNLITPGERICIPSPGHVPSNATILQASSSSGSSSTTASTTPSCVGYYPVVSGDTLSGIASRAGVSLSALEQANPSISNPNLITPGERICIPSPGHVPSGATTGNMTTVTSTSLPTVQDGVTGTPVRTLQGDLNALTGWGLAVDGIFGPLTLQAVRAFQAARGITADGIVGPVTWANIAAGLAAQNQDPRVSEGPSPGISGRIAWPVLWNAAPVSAPGYVTRRCGYCWVTIRNPTGQGEWVAEYAHAQKIRVYLQHGTGAGGTWAGGYNC